MTATSDCESLPPIGPSGRTDHFRPLTDTDAPARLVVGPSGQVWSLAGRFPELIGTLDKTGTRAIPLPWALTPDQRARLAKYTRADLRPLPLPVAKYLPAPRACQRPPAARADSRPDEAEIAPPRTPDATGRQADHPIPADDLSQRNAELARRQAAGESLATLAEAFGLSPSGVLRAVRAYQLQQRRGESPAGPVRRGRPPVSAAESTRRAAELARRRAAGTPAIELAAEFGLSECAVTRAIRAHKKRQQRRAGAVA